ncbi:bifunctional UDP-N-acetylglucosamine diphosphorylase/glucosamine-1-phosphate N-acetyltransferase GlmU [Sulfuriferula thiophila]|uniref:bifunctional UDP-N-acetylglucosamine diphosphorylase/glucosamine-1-phosphate N-acetyltransferase GlmU n=1 Tax=Sulfuriferula thiophila TaxID=1781211 RepID=UPI000F6067AA|nr:bifunctional UDP-N-acetylglucosamine diphosphorylase/glucosamine-1-phosphate N-acetyltransferase GlmU [Sulfuriferula thiophila]
MISPFNIVILAAGRGTRMMSDLPKVLHPLAGKPMLAHLLDTARSLDPLQICVVYGYGGEQVPKAIGGSDITWVLQAEQHGTGHAVRQAVPHLADSGVTLILYGDVPLTTADTMRALTTVAVQDQLALLTVNLTDPTGYGRIVRNAAGKVTAIVEHKDADTQTRAITEVNTGLMALPTHRLAGWLSRLSNANAQGEYYLTDIIAMAVADGIGVQACQPAHHREILGVNSKAQLAELERLHQLQVANQLMTQGVTLLDPARIDVRGSLQCGRDVMIDVGCVFEGQVELGNNVSVGAHCVLQNVKIGAGTQIASFSHLVDAIVGTDNHIGPFARLRPGTILAADVHVGNFVEIKNSQVDNGSKINHLSYVGDSTVGKLVNIGAGTITCNYDGANKHRTVIEDNAFIGSDTQLVAPVTIGKGATIGAGSTITRDAPAGELTLSRSKQLTISGWQRPVKKSKG